MDKETVIYMEKKIKDYDRLETFQNQNAWLKENIEMDRPIQIVCNGKYVKVMEENRQAVLDIINKQIEKTKQEIINL